MARKAVEKQEEDSESPWQKTPIANLVRFKPSAVLLARAGIKGKPIRRVLKTKAIKAAKLHLANIVKQESQLAEQGGKPASGK